MNLKIAPHSIEAEQAVIGAVFAAPQVWDDVAHLEPDDFFRLENRTIWEAMKRDQSCRDFVTIAMMLTTADDRAYLAEINRNTPSAANAAQYAEIVKNRSALRKLIRVCNDVADRAFEMANPADAISTALREIESIGSTAVVNGPRHVSDVGGEWYEEFRARTKQDSTIVGLSTGFETLDRRWGGMRGGQVIVIAGRPKRGKSTLAANIAQNVASNSPALIFNMEMSGIEMIDRAVSYAGKINIGNIRNGQTTTDELTALPSVWHSLKESKLWIDDSPVQTINSIRLKAKAFVKRHGKALIVVDYLQLIRGDQRQSAYERVSEVSRGIKLLAKETDCPVIALVQMNRAIESAKRKPQLSDLRDSGAIEQDADVIAFVHQDSEEQDFSEIVTLAMRSGQPGTDHMFKDFALSRFVETPLGWTPPVVEKPKETAKPKKGFGFIDHTAKED